MYRPWASDLFQRYQLPAASSCCDGCHRVEIHYLGVANLQYGTLVSTAAFYEVTENDVPEPSKSISSNTTHLDTMMMDMDHGDEQAIDHHPDTIVKRASPVLFSSSLSSPMAPPPIAPETSLPPKKRRRHKVLRHDVVFCLDPPSSLHHHEPSTDLEYYLFPHDAITEAMNDHPPFEVHEMIYDNLLHANLISNPSRCYAPFMRMWMNKRVIDPMQPNWKNLLPCVAQRLVVDHPRQRLKTHDQGL